MCVRGVCSETAAVCHMTLVCLRLKRSRQVWCRMRKRLAKGRMEGCRGREQEECECLEGDVMERSEDGQREDRWMTREQRDTEEMRGSF